MVLTPTRGVFNGQPPANRSRHRRLGDQPVEVGLYRVWIAAVVSKPDVAVRTHCQNGDVHDSELSGYGLIDPPNRLIVGSRAEADDGINYRAGASFELGGQVGD